jgi:hypothetical protein
MMMIPDGDDDDDDDDDDENVNVDRGRCTHARSSHLSMIDAVLMTIYAAQPKTSPTSTSNRTINMHKHA